MRLHTPRKPGPEYEQLATFVGHGYHIVVGKLLTCEREPKKAPGMYCGSKDDLSDTEQKLSCHAFAMTA